ncbi:MAG: hypothetical protein QW279_11025, partial [Candidatus Jordarchaeaceae archaeon]
MSRGALLTGTAGGIIGTITAGIGIIWSIIHALFLISLSNDALGRIVLRIFSILPVYTYQFHPLLYGIFYTLTNQFITAPPSFYNFFLPVSIILIIFIVVSGILTGVGFYGFHQAGGGAIGIVGLIFGIVGSVLGSAFIILGSIISISPTSPFTPITNPYLIIWIGM